MGLGVCTQVLEMPADRIWISVYENDDEAVDIWVKEVGIDPSHIVRLGKEDNFWEHGSVPAAPCSELYFDRGEKYGCGSPTCGVGCDCDRYVEFWNIVFPSSTVTVREIILPWSIPISIRGWD